MNSSIRHCPVCSGEIHSLGYRLGGVPSRSMTVLENRSAARTVPRGVIDLAECHDCGLVFNRDFDPVTQLDGTEYEESQDFSPTFRGYIRDLVGRLASRHELAGARILEIGCGKGGFLATLCEVTGATGVGIDPAVDPDRIPEAARNRLRVLPEFYGEQHRTLVEEADFICCRHTLEHILDPSAILGLLRNQLGGRETPIFLDVPAGDHVLEVGGCWDVYYEHCMYYRDQAFAGMLARSGFEVTRLEREFDGQYLCVEARVANGSVGVPPRCPAADVTPLLRRQEAWARWFDREAPPRVVLWGSGSRAVGLLGALGASARLIGVVDINPHRHGRWMPGFDQPILAPEELPELKPDAIVVMNPAYVLEIGAMLRELGLEVPLLQVDRDPV
ncbi:MAG: hypothetical protein CMJ23_04635 [Phycisphaerae bacterium]|nr:hypothetical protein [Phycisphaerae bacterium]